jgi:hypothetical protein
MDNLEIDYHGKNNKDKDYYRDDYKGSRIIFYNSLTHCR